MKKFINDPENLTAELLEGMTLAYPQKITLESEKMICRANPKSADKVAIVTLGGSGHEPALQGWVGDGITCSNEDECSSGHNCHVSSSPKHLPTLT